MTAALPHSPHLPGRRPLFGLELDALTMEEVLVVARDAITTHRRLLVGVVNAAKIVHMRKDAELRSSLLEADVLLADGQSVVWASRMLGRPLPERVAGCDLFERLLELADQEGRSVYLLGATPDQVRRSAVWQSAFVTGAGLLLGGLSIVCVLLALDLARLFAAELPELKLRRAYWLGLRTFGRRPFSALGLWAATALAVFIVWALYLAFRGSVPADTWPGIIALVLAQQAVMLARAQIRVTLWATLSAWLVPAEAPTEAPTLAEN